MTLNARHRKATPLAALACALALCVVPLTAEAQPGSQADVLFEEGNKAYDASDWPQAVKKYGEAFALKPTYDIAANLGAAELKLARFAEAANHLAFAIRNYPPSADAKKKAVAERLYGEARQKVGGLQIEAPAGADITVDGKPAGKAPLADPFFVDPGEHSVEVRGEGKTGTANARVLASESTSIKVEYGAETAGPTKPPPTGNEGNPDPEGPPLWPGIVLAAAGGVGIGVGVGLFVAGGSAESDADAIAAEIEKAGSMCNPATGSAAEKCAEGEDKQSTAQGLGVGSVIATGVGGALAVGGLVYIIWAATSEPSAEDTARVTPILAPGFLGGTLQSSF